MVNHPGTAQLVAYADGDASSVDLAAISAHVRRCAECAEAARTLVAVRERVHNAAFTDPPAAPRENWDDLSVTIHRHERRRTALRWTMSVAAASLVGAVLLTQMRRTESNEPGMPVALDTSPSIDGASDSALAALSRAVAAGRNRLSVTELHTMDELVRPIDVAIRQTRAAIESDPEDSFLRAHLAELRRKRVSALGDFVDLIRSRG